MPKKIIIFRHGETDHNLKDIMQGWSNVPLNELGLSQAKKLAKRFSSIIVDAMYSSDLKRALKTAKLVAKAMNQKVKKTKLLRERDMGIFSNMASIEAKEKFSEMYKKLKDRSQLHWKEHQGESRHEFQSRAMKLVKKLEKFHPNQTVLISTHGGLKRELMHALGITEGVEESYKNTAVSIVEKDEQGKYHLTLFNDTKHLDE